MADISVLSRLVNALQRNVDLAANTLVTSSIKVGGSVSNTELTKAILDRLVSLQNGTDVDATYHTHSTIYYTQTLLGATGTGSAGSTLIGDDNSYSNFTPGSATVKAALSAIDSALATAGGTAFSDSAFDIYNSVDNTKLIKFSAAGITTATTRTITMPDANVDLGKVASAIQSDGSVAFAADQPMGVHKLTGLAAGSAAGDSVRYEQAILASGVNAFAAAQSMGGFKLTNLGTPTADADAATKLYVDNVAQGLSWKETVRSATTAALPAYTEAGGVLTASANGALAAQDGVTLALNDRLLVKDETGANDPYNGIYTVTALGDAGNPWTLTRATDADTASKLNSATVEVSSAATTQAGYIFREDLVITTLETDSVAFVNLSKGLDWVFGNGLQTSGNNVSVKAADASISVAAGGVSVAFDVAGALATVAGGVAVKVDGSSIDINGSNQLEVAALGISTAKLAATSVTAAKLGSDVAGDGLSGGNGAAIAFSATAAAGTGLENDGSNNLRIASGAYDQSTITGGAGSAAAVQKSPLNEESMVAGESFAANSSFVVRMALNGETAGRVYKADKAAGAAGSETNTIYVIGIAQNKTASAITAGSSIPVVKVGSAVLQSADTAFTASSEEGLPVYLGAAGAFSTTASSTSNDAIVKVGTVRNVGASSAVEVGGFQVMGINP